MDYEPTDKPDVKVTDTPAIGLTFDQRIDDYRHMVFQTFVAADCRQTDLNRMLDKCRIAAERQKAIAHLPTLRGLLVDREAGLKEEVEKHLEHETERSATHSKWSAEQAASGRRGDKLSSSQVTEIGRLNQQIANSRSNIEQLKKQIAVDKRNIEQLERLIQEGE